MKLAYAIICHSVNPVEIEPGETNYLELFQRAHLPFDSKKQTLLCFRAGRYNLADWEDKVEEEENIFLISEPCLNGLTRHEVIRLNHRDEKIPA
ncbi:MAG: hypothetical protein U5L76_02975 [Patescibacteria group bacterium]|nr:hypothetical protein [Patescibacteria group bacterium]